MRLNFSKRYITLAPVATVIGLAFRMFDPDQLLGDAARSRHHLRADPARHAGHHDRPAALPAQHPVPERPGPGRRRVRARSTASSAARPWPARAGACWSSSSRSAAASRCRRMRPAARKAAMFATGAYARIRRQFNMPVGRFEGVEQVLARMAGSHLHDGCGALASPPARSTAADVRRCPPAMLKYHVTELGRRVANDAMDVHGGKGICLGPNNYLGRGYQSCRSRSRSRVRTS